jgi:hypothetical protein
LRNAPCLEHKTHARGRGRAERTGIGRRDDERDTTVTTDHPKDIFTSDTIAHLTAQTSTVGAEADEVTDADRAHRSRPLQSDSKCPSW